ncbi:conserved hypothetical protein [Ricinus communis]|uniref:Uncharacterized protein n=1 Tax=Ricinus communis TaxID=3988 RepID=B9S037_RICCO|nr:conserved hypothetical protein [Ricinus communis]
MKLLCAYSTQPHRIRQLSNPSSIPSTTALSQLSPKLGSIQCSSPLVSEESQNGHTAQYKIEWCSPTNMYASYPITSLLAQSSSLRRSECVADAAQGPTRKSQNWQHGPSPSMVTRPTIYRERISYSPSHAGQ